MTVTTPQMKQQFPGTGSQTVFNFSFAMPAGTLSQQAAQLLVIYTDSFGNQTTIGEGPATTQYQLAVNAPVAPNITPVGGSVTYNPNGTPIALNTTLTVIRQLPLTQGSSFANQANIYQGTFEAGLDYQVMLEQQIADVQNRAIVVNVVDPPPSELPPVAQRALQFLAFDINGNPIASPNPISGAISTAMQPVVAASTLALARAAMGVGGLTDNNTWSGSNTFSNLVLVGAVNIANGSPGQWFTNLNNVLSAGFPSSFAGYGQGFNANANFEVDFLNGDVSAVNSFTWWQQTGTSTRKQVLNISSNGTLQIGFTSIVGGQIALSGLTSGLYQITVGPNGTTCTFSTLGTLLGGSAIFQGQLQSGTVNGQVGSLTLLGTTSGQSSLVVGATGGLTITSQATLGIPFVDGANGNLFSMSSVGTTVTGYLQTVNAAGPTGAPILQAVSSNVNCNIQLFAKGATGQVVIGNTIGGNPGVLGLTNSLGQIVNIAANPGGSGAGVSGYWATNTAGIQTVTGNASITSGLVLVNTVGATTLTLPTLQLNVGTVIEFKMAAANANAIISSAANVVPLNANAPGTTIIAANGKFAKLVFDGTNWQVFAQG